MGVAFGTATLTIPDLVMVCFAIHYPAIIGAEEHRLQTLHSAPFSENRQTVPDIFLSLRHYHAPKTYQIHPRIVGNSIFEATWFVWFTRIAHLLYQLHQRTDFVPIWFTGL